MYKKFKNKKALNAKRLTLNAKEGFTLIEVLIYAGIVSGFIVIALVLAYQIIDYSDRLESQRELGENQRFLVQKINWVLSGVQAINSPAPGVSGATLSVNKFNFGQNPLVVDAVASTTRLKIGLAEAVSLTNRYASVSNLLFEHLNFSGEDVIRVTANLSNDVASTSIDMTVLIK